MKSDNIKANISSNKNVSTIKSSNKDRSRDKSFNKYDLKFNNYETSEYKQIEIRNKKKQKVLLNNFHSNEKDEFKDENKFSKLRKTYSDNENNQVKEIITKFKFFKKNELDEKERILQSFLKIQLNSSENGEYIHKVSIYSSNAEIFQNKVLNREYTWKDLNKKIIENQDNDKQRKPLVSVWGIPGCGKTFALKNFPLFFKYKDDILFSYVTMNESTQFNLNIENNYHNIMISRIIYDFLKKSNCKDIEFFLIRQFIEKNSFCLEMVLAFLRKLTKKTKNFISIDEISKIKDDLIRNETISMLGGIIDGSKNKVFLLLSTLNLSLTQSFITNSQRVVVYSILPPIVDFLKNIKNDYLKFDLENNKYLSLSAFELCSLPKRLIEFFEFLNNKNKNDLKEIIISSENIDEQIKQILPCSLDLNSFGFNTQELLLKCLEIILKREKIKDKGEKISGFKVLFYDIYASGIFICDNLNGYPIINSHIIKYIFSLDKDFLSKINKKYPIHDFMRILNSPFFKDYKQVNEKNNIQFNKEIFSLSYEYLTLNLDILLRKYTYYNDSLNPNTKERIYKMSYSNFYKKNFTHNESINFKIQNKYSYVDNSLKYEYDKDKTSIIHFLSDDDLNNLVNDNYYYFNINKGKAFDKLIIDYNTNKKEYIITFFQDTKGENGKSLKVKKFYDTLKGIKDEFNLLLSKIKDKYNKIKVSKYPRVVFYAYYNIDIFNNGKFKIEETYNKWYIEIIGKESLNFKFEGVLDTRLEFWNQ